MSVPSYELCQMEDRLLAAEFDLEIVDHALHAGNFLGDASCGSQIPVIENDSVQCNDAILDRDGDMFIIKKSIRPHGRLNPLLDLRVGYGLLDFLARYHNCIESRGGCPRPLPSPRRLTT